MGIQSLFYLYVTFVLPKVLCNSEEDHGVKYADKCEVCKVMATELESRLKETGKSSDVIDIGYSFDDTKKKKKEYKKSELRLIESLDGVCDRILEYNIHKERTDSTRFARGMSQTFKSLHGLKNKGVKVDLGIPYELWDHPSAEITNLKSQCEKMLEEYEDVIEDWYWNEKKSSLIEDLCKNKVLKSGDSQCLFEKGDTGSKKVNKDEL